MLSNVISRWNRGFDCQEMRAKKGGWTLHLDKAQLFSFKGAMDFLDAERDACDLTCWNGGIQELADVQLIPQG